MSFSSPTMIPRWFVLFLKSFLQPTWQLPDRFVPSGQAQYFMRLECLSIHCLMKYVKRRLVFGVALPLIGLGKRCQQIESKHHRILWVNYAAPSLGDSLMDLAARTLLAGKDVTLLTSSKNSVLYANDQYFNEVYTSSREVRKASREKRFDLVICDAYSPRVLWKKVWAAPRVEFVGLYEFLNGFEVHRTYFAFVRMMELLALEEISQPMRPTINLPLEFKDAQPEIDVCIAIGGEWSFRKYDHWPSVVSCLIAKGYTVSIVGSDNGIRDASKILESEPYVRSTVGVLSLSEVVVEIANARVFIGADGGLWHVACAIPRPSVVLFADCQIFDELGNRVTRETSDMICETLYTDKQVSDISCDQVIGAFERLRRKLG